MFLPLQKLFTHCFSERGGITEHSISTAERPIHEPKDTDTIALAEGAAGGGYVFRGLQYVF